MPCGSASRWRSRCCSGERPRCSTIPLRQPLRGDSMIDFALTARQAELQQQVTAFVRDQVIAREDDPRQSPHGPSDALRGELVALARAQGLLSPHAPTEYGGLGLDHRGMAVFFEAAGFSLLGPLAFNIQAPDEGNANLLNKVARSEQKEQWLRPLVAGEIRTVFSMTEPDH